MKPANTDASVALDQAVAIGASPLIVMDNISLGYNSGAVLTDVNLAIYPGNLVGLAGPNGSGKTTLFRTMLGLLAPISGTLVRNCPLAKFGYVPQSAVLDSQFPLSVLEIVEMGAYGRVKSFQVFPAHETKRAFEVLEQIALDVGDEDLVYGPETQLEPEIIEDTWRTQVQSWVWQRVRGYPSILDRRAMLEGYLRREHKRVRDADAREEIR